LEIGTSLVAQAIAELTNELEAWRLEQLEKQEKEAAPQITPLTKEERESAQAFLKGKDLMQRTGETIGQSGVIGEETNRLLMYLIFTSRKTE